jgi:MFS family permease
MKGRTYKNYLLMILLIIWAFNFVDRLALGLVQESIKVDLNLSDTQLGFLTGIAFALFYSIMGVPIARWADRGNRVSIIAVTIALWSAAVALCGITKTFLQLLIVRVGVAIGEAGCIPPAHSLIADYFTRAERPRAVALYMLAPPAGVLMGYSLAGWLNEFYGWRLMFILLGLPGLVLSALARFSLKEPRRQNASRRKPTINRVIRSAATADVSAVDRALPSPTEPRLKDVCLALWANTTFRHLLFSISVVSFFVSGIEQWRPTFFIRSYKLSTGELGTWLGIIFGLGAMVGTYLGGELASRRAANNERLQLRAMSVVFSGLAVISVLTYLSRSQYVAMGLMGVAAVIGATSSGPLFAVIQTLVPPSMRATSVAIIYLLANLIGMGLGPLAAGVLSDALRPWVGDESLRYALLALSPGYLWSGWHLWQASTSVTHDLEKAQCDQRRGSQGDHVAVNTSVQSPVT